MIIIGGDERIRTADLPRAKRTLYQLSYIPEHFTSRTHAHTEKIRLLTMPTQNQYTGGPKST